MNTAVRGVVTSPVKMEERAALGLRVGDTVRVHQKIQDKGKTRLQIFEGLVLARKHGDEPGATFTVRKVASGVGVEKIYPLYSPLVDKLEIVKRAKVRRSKLYYIREKVAREVKRQMRRMSVVDFSTESGIEAAAREVAEAKAIEEAELKVRKEMEEAEAATAAAEAEALKAKEEAEAAATAPEVVEEETTPEAAPEMTPEPEAAPAPLEEVAATPEEPTEEKKD